MAPVIECVRCMSACLFYIALMILAVGHAFAKKVGDTEDVRAEDRATITACLDIAARVPLDNVASPTGAKVDAAAWMAYRARSPKLAASNCIGAVSTPCLQDPDQYGTTGNMAECLTREFRVWDERLNAAYKQRMKGCQNKQDSKDDKLCAVRHKLERAWIAYRDALCDLPFVAHGGSFASVEYADCMLNETARQAVWIEQQK
jgi:uncharacterized protein YecT (DUF1311 family)